MTTPMTTPNIPDEVVRAAQAAEDAFWAEDSNYPKKAADYDNQAMLDKATRLMLEAALPLLLEQVGYRWSRDGEPCSGLFQGIPSERELVAQRNCREVADWQYEPLYRLKVSNEQ